jgi:hypothetical protein
MLTRGGPYQRSARLVAAGFDPETASAMAAAQGKGHVAELSQSARFTTHAAAFGSPLHARPNAVANDPRTDVEVIRHGRRVHGAQLKVGSIPYVRRAARSRRYDNLIVKTEALDAVDHDPRITDRLGHAGIEAPPVTAARSEETAAVTLERMLYEEEAVSNLDVLVLAARASACRLRKGRPARIDSSCSSSRRRGRRAYRR